MFGWVEVAATWWMTIFCTGFWKKKMKKTKKEGAEKEKEKGKKNL